MENPNLHARRLSAGLLLFGTIDAAVQKIQNLE
jgi:hypothetical protein